MTTHVRDPNLYFNDRNIYDGLKGATKATPSVLLALARQRGLILSELTPKDDIILYLSRLAHSWHDIKSMIDLLNTADRAEKKQTRALPFRKTGAHIEQLLKKLQARQAEAQDEVWKVTTANKGKTAVVTIKYAVPDFTASAMTRLTEHTCRIEFTPDHGSIQVRYPKQGRAEQLVGSVLRMLNEEDDQDREAEEITLSDVRSNRLRSEFFTKIIEGIPGFRLHEVSSVRGNNGSLSSKPTLLENRAAAALKSAIKKVTLSGRSITKTDEFRQFFGRPGNEPDFHVTSISWICNEQEGMALQAEFEAGFAGQANCTGFAYRVRKVWYRNEGVLRRVHSAPAPEDERRLMELVEAKAREVCRQIRAAAGVGVTAPSPPRGLRSG